MHIASLPSPRLGADWGGLAVPAPHPHIPTHTTIIIIFVIITLQILRAMVSAFAPQGSNSLYQRNDAQQWAAAHRCILEMRS